MKLRHADDHGDSPFGTKRLGFSGSLAISLAAAVLAFVGPLLPLMDAGFFALTLLICIVAAGIWLVFGLATLVR
jgi:hypothetical protein